MKPSQIALRSANYLNRRIFETLSCTRADEDPLVIPFYITSTTFTQKDYKECADKFKVRLGLEGQQDLFVLRNVVMSPFTTTRNFVSDLVDEFKVVLEREVKVCKSPCLSDFFRIHCLSECHQTKYSYAWKAYFCCSEW